MTRRALLYTEMVTADAVIHGRRDQLIDFDAAEHPIALQLGGSDPRKLAEAARIGEDFGYDEINLNVGCPSDRVQEGRFGACLMAEPQLVADCVASMRSAVSVPVTVKCRIGIDDQDAEADFQAFVDTVAAAGCDVFVVHARKAWLKGLSPKENREIPPLDYERVHRLKRARPHLTIVLNGGLTDLDVCEDQISTGFDGVMLGRAAYQNPFVLANVDQRLFGDERPPISRAQVLRDLVPYVERQLARGVRLQAIVRHVLGLMHAMPGGRAFRRHLSENAPREGAGVEVLLDALRIVERHEVMDEARVSA